MCPTKCVGNDLCLNRSTLSLLTVLKLTMKIVLSLHCSSVKTVSERRVVRFTLYDYSNRRQHLCETKLDFFFSRVNNRTGSEETADMKSVVYFLEKEYRYSQNRYYRLNTETQFSVPLLIPKREKLKNGYFFNV